MYSLLISGCTEEFATLCDPSMQILGYAVVLLAIVYLTKLPYRKQLFSVALVALCLRLLFFGFVRDFDVFQPWPSWFATLRFVTARTTRYFYYIADVLLVLAVIKAVKTLA